MLFRCLTALYLLVLQVEFSSLDFLLHTKALLSTINYLNSTVPPQLSATRNPDSKKQVEKPCQGRTGESKRHLQVHQCDREAVSSVCALCAASKGAKDGGMFSFKLFAMLGCFHVEVCDDCRSIADIRVQGMNMSHYLQVPVSY